MPEVMEWPQEDSRAALARALEHLRAGRLVVFPAESAYLLAGGVLAPSAWAALERVTEITDPPEIILGQAVAVFDWLPFLRGTGTRLARRFWPGPLTLVSGSGLAQGVWSNLPEQIGKQLAPERRLAVSFPHHEAIRLAARALGTPLFAVPTPWTNPDEVQQAFGDEVGLILEDGPTQLGELPTVVQVHGRTWSILREGAIAAAEIEAAAVCRILFVCTGNTCRSPMAESLCRKLLADRLACRPEELPGRGFHVQSAGLAAMMGCEASPEAVETAREFGADLTSHASQPLTMDLLLQADRLFGMTDNHLRMLYGIRGVVPRLLSRAGEDVSDPIGGTVEVYRACARQIMGHLEELLPELLEC